MIHCDGCNREIHSHLMGAFSFPFGSHCRLCEDCKQKAKDDNVDGLGGTDGAVPEEEPAPNVLPLFSNRPSAAPLPPQPEVIGVLETLLSLAQNGKITGLALVAFDELGGVSAGTLGKCPYLTLLGALDNLKFEVELNNALSKRPGQGKGT